MSKKKATKPKASDEPEVSEREALLARFGEACATAAEQREANRALRQEYRGSSKKRKAMERKLVADLQRVFEHPDNPYSGWAASRKRYRDLGHYPEIMVTDLFGTHAEFERAAGLRDKRGMAILFITHDLGVVGELADEVAVMFRGRLVEYGPVLQIFEYAEHEVMANVGRWSKQYRNRQGVKHVIVGSDFHSQFVDPLALKVWMDVIEMIQPDGIVFNGDVVDFPKVGRYSQMPGAGSLSIQEELDFAREQILRPSIERAPKAWRTFHVGNHEQRLVRYIADSAPALASLRSLSWRNVMDIDDLDIEMVFGGNWMAPTQKDRNSNVKKTWKVYYDCLAVHHGTSIAKNSWEVELARFGMSVTCGHTHRPGVFAGGTLASPNLTATQTGMMAGYAVGKEYAQVPDSANWTMGFAVFTIDPANGIVVPHPITITEEFATFAGHVWRPTKKMREIRRAMWGENGDVTAHVRRESY